MKLVHEGTSSASPVWDVGSASLLWTDGPTIHRLHPGSGTRTETVVPQPISAVLPRTNGGPVANLRDGIGLHHADGRVTWLVYWHRDGAEAGPAAIDHTGDLGAMTGKQLVRVQPDGRATLMLDASRSPASPQPTTSTSQRWRVSNCSTRTSATAHTSPRWAEPRYPTPALDNRARIATPDSAETTNASSDNRPRVTAPNGAELANPSGDDRIHIAAPNTAELTNPSSDNRIHTATPNRAEPVNPGTGDLPSFCAAPVAGLCIDAGGFGWGAAPAANEIRRIAPTGSLDRVLNIAAPTGCCFGGPDSADRYVTAGSVYVVPAVGLGAPTSQFPG